MASWHPDYPDRKDRRVKMDDGDLQTSISDRRPVISLTGEEMDSPACFWIDRDHIYLRLDWDRWYPVEPSNPQHAAALCSSYYCRIVLSTGNGFKEMIAPVFHVAELTSELFKPSDGASVPSESFVERKQKAIAMLADAIPDDVDAMPFRRVLLDGVLVDFVVSSDDKGILFSVFPEDETLVAVPRGEENDSPDEGKVSVKCLDDLLRQRDVLEKMQPGAEVVLAVVAGTTTLESMAEIWTDELDRNGIELVDYSGYEPFLRFHFPPQEDDGDSADGDDSGDDGE